MIVLVAVTGLYFHHNQIHVAVVDEPMRLMTESIQSVSGMKLH